METYKGMDGMKTGYVGPSGFNLVASAVQKDHRLIGVVFGGKSTASRNSHMAALLDRGFDRVGDIRIAKANTQQAPVPATKPLVSDKELIAANAITSPSPSSGITAAALNPANDAPPVPPKKPAILVAINTLNKAAPGEVKLASLAPVVDPDKFGELVGEGDIDPAETRRIETGLVAASAIRGEELKNERMLTAPTADDTWSIQIGAYSSRATSDQAIHAAAKKLPVALSGNPAIAPLKIKDGWVFRARLGGYSREEAFQACKYVKDCMPVAPQNN
jgi:D-alanyl-D-alanine carboxypeptidase